MSESQLNVFGRALKTCSNDPLTGFFRDGCCNSSVNDQGEHTVCAIVSDKFLNFSLSKGNDLVTPRKEFNFPGLIDGDRWCLCADRWIEAYQNECAPRIVLEATNIDVLKKIDIEILKKFALDLN
ncbi:MAG: hypothetical protein CMM92_01930 [Rickettsiales bacterium]|nr:hypothetical protein [Rickettsiales bacterium]RPG15354.1 MAG: DUF2237 domain-containing protein [Pelagibacteraceae bacterium TMED195]|tara:strand:+ start:1594 stop:1968 length:375 start_codon:yes stop_codon:yes gene_type:complete